MTMPTGATTMRTRRNPSPRSGQSGAVLLVAVVLLLLAGVMTLAALNVGMFEQRSTGNDVRAKEVNEIAEAGMAQGFEYLMRQHPDMLEDDTLWEKCGAADTKFPCGAVTDELYDNDADGTTAPVARRSTMFRLTASGHVDSNFDNAMTPAMLTLNGNIATTGNGTQVAYGVAPVLCYVAARLPGEATTSPVRCADSKDEASNRRIVTFVSVARMPGEGSRSTLTQTIGRYALLDTPSGKPPIVASGSVDITGGLQLVTNPNAGGAGVPVSVWTRKDVSKTGTPNTCYADEFFRFGAKNNAPPTMDGSTIICDTCQCNGDKSLSYDKSGNVQDEGIDILDVEGDSSTPRTGQSGVNYNVKSDALSYPLCEFPPDLFSYIFGVNAWIDTNADCFAETKVMSAFTNPNNGAEVTIGADEAFLYSNALYVINPTVAGAVLKAPGQTYVGTYPSSSLSGLIWCQSNCDVGSNTQLGTPANPVVLVIDGSARIQGRVFGLVYMRSKAGTATLTPSTGYVMTSTEVSNGGNAVLDMNAGATVYGAVVVQGQVDKANGTAAIIFDASVLDAIGNNPNNNRYATLPGAWNDISSY
jgi:Tfp pilus assembly protein PilX